MPVSCTQIRNLLLPGLMDITGSLTAIPPQFDYLFLPIETPMTPMVGPVAAVAIGAAAMVIKNPEVTRRFLPWRNE